ncbi:MAG: VanZ family protein [Lachnospiraceae bacterium]|nr:VanZ family protein [Lachnospiraceae bacterium]MCM1230379.1 VanZ family protein [Ruminococcus flavefaciens]
MKQNITLLWKSRNRVKFVLFIAYCLFIVYYTLLSREVGDSHRADLRFMWAYQEMLIGHPEWKEDVGYNLKNILFFIPFGFLFPGVSHLFVHFKNRKWLFVLCCGAALSFLIEIAQYIFCLGLCELDDVLCNGLGALIGYWLCLLASVMIKAQNESN